MLHVQYPMQFKITNPAASRHTHCGVQASEMLRMRRCSLSTHSRETDLVGWNAAGTDLAQHINVMIISHLNPCGFAAGVLRGGGPGVHASLDDAEPGTGGGQHDHRAQRAGASVISQSIYSVACCSWRNATCRLSCVSSMMLLGDYQLADSKLWHHPRIY